MPLRFLITDDSATNRKLFTMVAERMGHHADAAASGREAIEFFAAHAYDIGFFDLTMLAEVERRGQSGRSACARRPAR